MTDLDCKQTEKLIPQFLKDELKIEGRMKSPEYVAGVTAIYRKYMDLYLTDREHWQIDPKQSPLI